MGKNQKPDKPEPPESLAALAAYLSFGRTLDDDELLRLIIEIGVSMMQADEGSLLLLHRDQEELEFMITIGRPEVEKELKSQRFSMHQGITGLAAATGEPQTGVPTYRGVKQPYYQDGRQKDPTAVLAAPMVVEDEVIGVITAVSFKEGRTFSSDEVQLYCKFAGLCGEVIRQRRREEALLEVLLGEAGAAALSPEIHRMLAGRGLRNADRAVAEIARNLGQLSRGREEILPLCTDLVRIMVQIAGSLGWKTG